VQLNRYAKRSNIGETDAWTARNADAAAGQFIDLRSAAHNRLSAKRIEYQF
jgi:hypothetical protein